MERGAGAEGDAADLDEAVVAPAPPAPPQPPGPPAPPGGAGRTPRARRAVPLLLAAAAGAVLGAAVEGAHLRAAGGAARGVTAPPAVSGPVAGGSSPPRPPSDLGGVRTGTWSYLDDRVQVALADADPPGSPPVRIGVLASPGLRATTVPPAPFDLPAGRSTFVDVRVHPDCRLVGDGSMSYLQLVVLGADGQPEQQVTHDLWQPQAGVREGTSVWLARRTAAACG